MILVDGYQYLTLNFGSVAQLMKKLKKYLHRMGVM
jgi:hypothetical protein